MGDGVRWLVAIALAVCVIGLIAYARGPDHYRGNEIGSHGTKVVIVRTDND